MSHQSLADGIHIRGLASHAKDDESIAMLTLQIWPLPADVLPGLHDHLRETANAYLTKRGLASGVITDLTAKGPPQ